MTALDKIGGKRARGPAEERMLHFRTLDWGMDPLRSVSCSARVRKVQE